MGSSRHGQPAWIRNQILAVSKCTSAFGGFELDRFDRANGEHTTTTTTTADPNAIADDILACISRR